MKLKKLGMKNIEEKRDKCLNLITTYYKLLNRPKSFRRVKKLNEK